MTGNPKNTTDPSVPTDPSEQDTSSAPAQGSDAQTAPEDTSTTSPWIKPKTA